MHIDGLFGDTFLAGIWLEKPTTYQHMFAYTATTWYTANRRHSIQHSTSIEYTVVDWPISAPRQPTYPPSSFPPIFHLIFPCPFPTFNFLVTQHSENFPFCWSSVHLLLVSIIFIKLNFVIFVDDTVEI